MDVVSIDLRRGRDDIEHVVGLHKKHKHAPPHTSINMPDYAVQSANHMEVEVESDRKARIKRERDLEYATKVILANKKANIIPSEVPLPPETADEEVINTAPFHNLNNMAYYRKRKYRRSSCCGSSTRKRRRSLYPRAFPRSKYGATFVQRGTEKNLEAYGADWKTATGTQLSNRRASGFTGRGAYGIGKALRHGAHNLIHQGVKDLKHLGGAVLRDAVSAGRAAFDASPEGQAFNQIYGAVGGRGAYEVTSNQLINPAGPSNAMHTTSDETNDIMFSRSEYLQDLNPTVSTAFQTIFSASLNPGLPVFPWLSQIACFFEEYEWVQLLFEVRSMVTEGNTNASGTIVHATQYNPANGLFTSKQKMENYEYANSHKVTDHGQHGIECDPEKRAGSASEYVRTGAVPTGQDIKSYDLGLYQLAVCNTGATAVNLGELWVHYTVKLKKTKIPDPGSIVNISAPYGIWTSTQTASNAIGDGTWSDGGSSTQNNIVLSFSGNNPLTITLPATFTASQYYDVIFKCTNATPAGVAPFGGLVLSGTNCTIAGSQNFNSPAMVGSAGSTITNLATVGSFRPNGAGQVVLTITPGTNLPLAGACSLQISLRLGL